MGRRVAGAVAGYVDKDGRIQIRIDNVLYGAHRLAWFYVYEEWPNPEADHRDLDPSNNRIANLRPATKSGNAANTGIRSTNTSGHKGVSFDSTRNKWAANVWKDSKRCFLGRFETKDEAAAAYAKSAIEMHGEFARLS